MPDLYCERVNVCGTVSMWHECVFGWPLTPKYVDGILGWSVQSLGPGPNLSDSRRVNAMTSGHGMSDTRATRPIIWLLSRTDRFSIHKTHIQRG
jgi:hypothetical protein